MQTTGRKMRDLSLTDTQPHNGCNSDCSMVPAYILRNNKDLLAKVQFSQNSGVSIISIGLHSSDVLDYTPEWVVLLLAQCCSEVQKSQLHALNQDMLAGCFKNR